MTQPYENAPPHHQDEAELQRIRAKLVRLMLFSIIITFILVGLVLAAVIYKIMAVPEPSSNSGVSMEQTGEQQIDVTLDGEIVSYRLAGDVVTIQSRNSGKSSGKNPTMSDEFIFYDYRQGRILSRLKFFLTDE